MDKRGEIREGIRAELEKHLHLPVDASEESNFEKDMATDEFLDDILAFLHSRGVVIKVDRELPKDLEVEYGCTYEGGEPYFLYGKEALSKAGYVAVEPLIDDDPEPPENACTRCGFAPCECDLSSVFEPLVED